MQNSIVEFVGDVDLSRYRFRKMKHRFEVFRFDYVFTGEFNPEYGYYLRAVLSIPRTNSDDLRYQMCKLRVMRYDPENMETSVELLLEESEIVYVGLIPSGEFLEDLLIKTGIVGTN